MFVDDRLRDTCVRLKKKDKVSTNAFFGHLTAHGLPFWAVLRGIEVIIKETDSGFHFAVLVFIKLLVFCYQIYRLSILIHRMILKIFTF